jgi:hypothetical protein
LLVLKEVKAAEPIMRSELPTGLLAYNTHLFTVEKFRADGTRDKFKSCLVAHGNEQDTTMYWDWHLIMMCLAAYIQDGQYVAAKLDVKGAFIQTEMSGVPAYIQCRGRWHTIMSIIPEQMQYVRDDNALYCRLKKALYGCVQASKL